MLSDVEMDHLKTLARLELSPAETEALQTDLNKLLTYFDRLSELDTEGVEELARPVVLSNVFREDTVQNGLGQQGRRALRSRARTVSLGCRGRLTAVNKGPAILRRNS